MKMKNIVLLTILLSAPCAWGSEIQRNIDTRYKELLRKQEMDNRTTLTREKALPDKKEKIPSEVKRRFDSINVHYNRDELDFGGRIDKILEPYMREKLLGKNEIEEIQYKLQRLYMSKGYVMTRVYIDGDAIKNGKLEFIIYEGYIEDIRFLKKDGSRYGKLANALQQISFYPLPRNALLNINDLDQGIEQMNRLSSNNATMNILPGSRDGYSLVEISNESSKRFNIALSADNSGVKNSGYYKANASINSDNLLMVNDNIYFNYSRNIDGSPDEKVNNSYFASLSVPLGYFTLMYSFFSSDYYTATGTSVGHYVSDGSTLNQNASVEMAVKRGKRYKLSAGGSISLKETANYYAGSQISISSKKLTVGSGFLTLTYYLNSSMIYGKLSYIRGLDWFGVVKNKEKKGYPQGQFSAAELYVQYNRNFPLPLVKLHTNYSASVNMQYSPDSLYGTEQISLGGQSSVRGYKEGSVSGNSGGYFRNELRWRVSEIFGKERIPRILGGLSVNAFFDYGYVKEVGGKEENELGGAGIGFGYRGRYCNMSWVWSRSVYNRSYLKEEGDVLYVSVEWRKYF